VCLSIPESTLLNKLLGKTEGGGFKVGSTSNACTKGLWVHEEVLVCKDELGEFDVLVFDSEGFGSLEEPDQNYDYRLFLIINLFTELLVFNCKLAIDSLVNQRLALVTQMTKQIIAKRVKAPGTSDADAERQMAQYFPRLIIVIRDAQLKLEDKQNRPITANQYLENAWESAEAPAPAPALDESGAPIAAVVPATVDIKADMRNCYTKRACVVMPQPVNNNKFLEFVNALPASQLAPEFVTALDEFRSLAFKMLAPKRIEGVSINGASLVEYIRSALPSINDGTIPLVEDSVQAMSAKQGQQLHSDAMAKWQDEFHVLYVQQQQSIGTAKPLLFDPDVIDPHIQKGVDTLVAGFMSQLFKNASSAQQEARLRKELQAKATEICESNMRQIRAFIQSEAAKYEAQIGAYQDLEMLQRGYTNVRTTVCAAINNTKSSRIKEMIDSFLPCDKILHLSMAVYEKQSRDMRTTIGKLQEDQATAEQAREALTQLQESSKGQLRELEESRAAVGELRERLATEIKALQDGATKERGETRQTIEQLTNELTAATERCTELNAQLLAQMSDQGELANERERSIVEQGLLIEQLRKDQERHEADLAHAATQIQQLREQAAMVDFWQGKANQAETDLSTTRSDLAQCQSARTETDEERATAFNRLREETYQLMQEQQIQQQIEQQHHGEEVAVLQGDLQASRQKYADETRKQSELIAQLQLQLGQTMEANRRHETTNGELKDKLLALTRAIEERHEANTAKIIALNAQAREDAKARNESDTLSQKQRVDETLDLNRQLMAAKSEASISMARLNEISKRVAQLEKEGEDHKRLREEHREMRDDYSRQAGEFTMLRTKSTDTDNTNRSLMTENNQLKDAYRELKSRYDMDVFKATIKSTTAPAGRSWVGGGGGGAAAAAAAAAATSTIPTSNNATTSMLLGR